MKENEKCPRAGEKLMFNQTFTDEGVPMGTIMIDEKNPEQAAKTVHRFGKFQTGEELIKAYNNLEAEFTRRSQKLKELEDEKVKLISTLQATKNEAENSLNDDKFIDENIVKNDRISQKIIDSYLKDILSSSAPTLNSKTGRSALTPVNRPKDLKEAKKLADILLRS